MASIQKSPAASPFPLLSTEGKPDWRNDWLWSSMVGPFADYSKPCIIAGAAARDAQIGLAELVTPIARDVGLQGIRRAFPKLEAQRSKVILASMSSEDETKSQDHTFTRDRACLVLTIDQELCDEVREVAVQLYKERFAALCSKPLTPAELELVKGKLRAKFDTAIITAGKVFLQQALVPFVPPAWPKNKTPVAALSATSTAAPVSASTATLVATSAAAPVAASVTTSVAASVTTTISQHCPQWPRV